MRRLIYECRCNERLKAKNHIRWIVRGTGTPKDRDEVNRREVWECDGWVCDWEAIGVSSILRLIRNTVVLMRIFPVLDLKCEKNVVRRYWNWLDSWRILFYKGKKKKLELVKLILKGKMWGLSVGKSLVRVFRNPLKRIILPLSKAGHMQTLVGERWSFERRVSHPRWNLQQVSGFSLFENQSFLQHVTCRSELRRNALWKQGRTDYHKKGSEKARS